MATLILPPEELNRMIRRRRAAGGDRHDEVWDGVYVMSPLADNVHQAITSDLVVAIKAASTLTVESKPSRAATSPTAPISGGKTTAAPTWRSSCRATRQRTGEATGWAGPTSPPRSSASTTALARTSISTPRSAPATCSLSSVERRAWNLTYFNRDSGDWSMVGISEADRSHPLHIASLGFTFRLIPGDLRPLVEVGRPRDGATWMA